MSTDKQHNYEQIRVNKDNDLAWVKNIVWNLWREEKITIDEWAYFYRSLCPERKVE